MLADRSGQDALVAAVGVINAPGATDRALVDAFPGLIEGFDQVVLPVFLFGEIHEAANETGLIVKAGQRPTTRAALGWPAGFADENAFCREFFRAMAS